MNTAIIVAAGKGTRMGTGINKQYLALKNKPILAHTIEMFQKSSSIHEIILIIDKDDELNCRTSIVEKYAFDKVSMYVAGGKERQNSVFNGLMKVKDECDIVVVHDGARPLVTSAIIEKCVEGAKTYHAVSAGVPIKDTIKILDADGFVQTTPNRKDVWITQTPQAFKRDILMKAHLYAIEHGILGTDDAMLVEAIGQKVKMIQAGYENIKITTPEDLISAEAIIDNKTKFHR